MTILCNSCGKEIGGQALTTTCSHCFCLECANQICQGDNSCPVCGSQLDGSNVSVEVCGHSEAVLRSLRGSSPEEIIMVVSEALVFNETQRHLANKLQAKSHKGKCKQVVDSSKAKMAEMHKSYKNLVQKAKSISQDKAQKQAMLEELRKKAQESSRICRKLQEQLKAQQTKSTILHQQVGLDHGLSPTSSGAGRLPGMHGSKMQSQALVPSKVNRSHGHIPHTVCAPHQKLLQHHSHSAGPSSLKTSSGLHGMKRIMPPANPPPASPTLGGAPTPSDGNGTSLSGRSGSGVSMLLQGNGRRQPSATGSDPLGVRRHGNLSSPRNSCGSLSDLIKSRKR